MVDDFDPEWILTRWIALEEDKWSRFRAYRTTLTMRDLPSHEKLRLMKDWMADVNESQREERTRLLKQLRVPGLSLQISQRGWDVVQMPPDLEEC